jgi:hypothetical protein
LLCSFRTRSLSSCLATSLLTSLPTIVYAPRRLSSILWDIGKAILIYVTVCPISSPMSQVFTSILCSLIQKLCLMLTRKPSRNENSGSQFRLSLTGVDFTSHSRPVFTRHSRSVFTRHDRPVFTTHRRPVFTTVAESLPIKQWERNSEHGADPHEYLHRNYLPVASRGK